MKGLLILICSVISFQLIAQINSFPNNEGFEAVFTEGSDVEFISNWTGNTVASTNRIFQSGDSRTGLNALAVQPISSFDGEILIAMNLTSFENAQIDFYAKSNQNGSGDRAALVYFSTSVDGGNNFGTATQIGDNSTFPNSAGESYSLYSYSLDAFSDNQSNVVVRLFVERDESGSGSAAEFVMDDVTISADPLVDTDPPLIQSVTAISDTEVDVQFNENVDATTSQNAGNYAIDGSVSVTNAVRDGTDLSLVHLTTSTLTNGSTYTITINNVEDENSNVIAVDSEDTFDYLVFEEAEEFDVVINEFMPDPNPVVTTLPDAEYVELYNRSTKYFNLENWTLDGQTLPAFTLAPDAYVIVVEDDDIGLFGAFPDVIDISSLTLNNSSVDDIILQDDNTLTVHSILFEGSTGGISTELINPNGPDYSENNFGLSTDPDGGTPGEQNSIFDDTPDTTPPTIESITVISNTELDVSFSELLDESSAEISTNYSIDGGIGVISADLDASDNQLIHLVVDPLVSGEVRILSVNGVEDLSGNLASDSEQFEYLETEEAVAGDVIINEFLSNPVNNNDDFIELFNNSSKFIDMAGWNVSDETSTSEDLSSFILRPGEYLIIYDEDASIDYSTFGNALTIASLTLNNADDQIELVNGSDTQIAFLVYEDEQEDGVSLELVNPNDPCVSLASYRASVDPSGSTPGAENSVFDDTPDTEAPTVLSNNFDTNLTIIFSEVMDAASLVSGSYSVSGGITVNEVIVVGSFPNSVEISFNETIEQGVLYDFTIAGVTDCSGNAIEETTIAFGIGRSPSFNELIITEIMFDPDPQVELPDEEFIEIYNATSDIVSTDGISLTDASETVELPARVLNPGEYYVLSSTSAASDFSVNSIGVPGFPSLNNGGEQLLLTLGDELIFSLTYDPEWHDDDKSDGGFTLEMKDITNPCLEDGINWGSSQDNRGGTPAEANSITEVIPDNFGPELVEVTALSADSIRIDLSEKIDPSSIASISVSLNPIIGIEQATFDFGLPSSISIKLSSQLEASTPYTISIENITDCSGNEVQDGEVVYALPVQAEEDEVKLSEVLFNPRSGGVDFVELYNDSEKYISLKDWKLGNLDDNGEVADVDVITDNEKVIGPGEYLVLTTDANVLLTNYPQGESIVFFEVSAMPSYPNDEGTVLLMDPSESIIESFTYNEDFHYNLLESVDGVSLERVSYEELTSNPDNWRSASSTEDFATPGYANSQSFMNDRPVGRVTASPEVFIPGNAGSGRDFTTINYQFDQPGQFANVNIYDQSGRLVKNLAQGVLLSTSGFLRWDGDTNDGKIARMGYHLIIFEIYDSSGNSEIIKETVVVGRDF